MYPMVHLEGRGGRGGAAQELGKKMGNGLHSTESLS